jgi:hypothetical protein
LLKGLHDIAAWMRSVLTPGLRIGGGFTLAVVALAIAAAGGCHSSSTPAPLVSVSPSPTASPTPTGATPTPTPNYLVSMVYAIATPTVNPTYGTVDGYGLLAAKPTASPTSTPAPSQIITLAANEYVIFYNFDDVPHTASLLGPANGDDWPPTFTNVNGVIASPPLTAITAPQFSSGAVAAESGGLPAQSSVYSTGSLMGIFFFGDYYDYLSDPPMRTVIIIE